MLTEINPSLIKCYSIPDKFRMYLDLASVTHALYL
jgi:hypothetical protein